MCKKWKMGICGFLAAMLLFAMTGCSPTDSLRAIGFRRTERTVLPSLHAADVSQTEQSGAKSVLSAERLSVAQKKAGDNKLAAYYSGEEIVFLEHGSPYDIAAMRTDARTAEKVKDYVYGNLGEVDKSLSKYRYDEKMTLAEIEKKTGDPFSGVLDGDKVINLYYGYFFRLTIHYVDKYTGEKIADSFISGELENGTDYDYRDLVPDRIPVGEKEYLLTLGGCDAADLLSGTISDDIEITVRYGYYDNVTVNYLDKYDLAQGVRTAIRDPFKAKVEHLAAYDYEKQFTDYPSVSFGGKDYYYSGILTDDEGTSREYVFGAITGGLLKDEAIKGDVVVDITYGYTHTITVNYVDKYTGETIHSEVITVGERLSDYDNESDRLSNVDYHNVSYFYDGAQGDLLAGKLDSDKNATLHYGYNNVVTVKYREKGTDKVLAEERKQIQEHNTAYDRTADTELEIGGYQRLAETTGDPKAAVLDTDREITVWYTKTGETQPDTGDRNNYLDLIVPGILVVLLLAAFVILRIMGKKRENKN